VLLSRKNKEEERRPGKKGEEGGQGQDKQIRHPVNTAREGDRTDLYNQTASRDRVGRREKRRTGGKGCKMD